MDEARRQKGWIINSAAVFGMCFALLGFLSTLLIPLVYGSLSGSAQSVARGIVCVAAAYMVVWCVVNVQFAVSRTGGDTTMGVIVDSIGTLMMFLPAMVLLARFTALGPVAMYAITKLSDFYKVTVAAQRTLAAEPCVGKRGRGAAGKTPVFGLLKRSEKVYVTVVQDCSRESLMPIIKGLILKQSTIYTDGWGRMTALCSGGYEHYRVSLETSL